MPEKYLAAMGWELAMDENHQHSMVRTGATLPMETETTIDYSVNDILDHCYETGYVKGDPGHRTIGKLNEGSLMSFSSQPTMASSGLEVNTASPEITTANFSGNMGVKASIDICPPPMPLDDFHVEGSAVNEDVSSISQLLELRDGPRNQHEFMTELDDALNDLRGPNPDDDDLFAPFNPAIETPIVHYDPLASEPFDAFDIHEFMNL